MYGILPLAFKGGHLALDILFFAPATMFNLRGAFPFYQVDVADGVIRYKDSRDAPWMEYHPKSEEIARARTSAPTVTVATPTPGIPVPRPVSPVPPNPTSTLPATRLPSAATAIPTSPAPASFRPTIRRGTPASIDA